MWRRRRRSRSIHPARDWDAVILDNYPDHELAADEDSALERYVYAGGGLIFIAGDSNAKLAQEPKTPFEKMLPVRAEPPPEKPTAVVLVLDKSGSMSGPKIEMARDAARASIKTLRPIDIIGVISFDETFNWVIPMGPAGSLEDKSKLINQITANGGTKIYQAVQSAYDAIVDQKATHKHIILLTDGVSTPGTQEDFPKLEREALAKHVTISTIGVGDYINRELLDELAHKTKGKSHFVENPESIPQIINAEVKSTEDLAIQERPVRAVRVRPVEFIDGIDFTKAPRLRGFVQAEAKEGSETILRVDGKKPLLVRWRYGLGRVIAFMSDAKSRWAAPWVRWESFGTLWPQMVRDVSHRDRTVRAGVRPGTREGEAVVFYDVLADAGNPAGETLNRAAAPHILVEVPGESPRSIPLEADRARPFRGAHPGRSGRSLSNCFRQFGAGPARGRFLSRIGRDQAASDQYGAARRDQPRDRRPDASVDRPVAHRQRQPGARTKAVVAVLAHPRAGVESSGSRAAQRILRASGDVAAPAIPATLAPPAG